jgi:acetyl-CoA acetyltransferase
MNVIVAGTGITPFGFLSSTSRQLAATATGQALDDAGIGEDSVGLVVVGNAAAGILIGQEMIRAQTSLADSRLVGVPAMTVENACASSSSAFLVGCMAIESGMHEAVVVLGVEKMSGPDRSLPNRALATAMDVEVVVPDPASPVFMEHYAAEARKYMALSGATARDFASVAAKNSRNGSMNPVAQVRRVVDADEVLAARLIVDPLTRPMCSSIADGAAAVVLASPALAARKGIRGPRVLAIAAASGQHHSPDHGLTPVELAAQSAYEQAALGPGDVDVAEVHDAASPAELELVERLGFAAGGDAPALARSGALEVNGSLPVNPSGGLIARGHPIGATGVAQIVELVDQLRGRCGPRQVSAARVGLAENAGGLLGSAPAACVVTILGVA